MTIIINLLAIAHFLRQYIITYLNVCLLLLQKIRDFLILFLLILEYWKQIIKKYYICII